MRWSQSMGMFKDTQNKDVALKFVQYILSPEGQASLATSSCYWAMPANTKAALTEDQKKTLRWDDQPGYLARAQLYPAPDAELDKKMQEVWTEMLQPNDRGTMSSRWPDRACPGGWYRPRCCTRSPSSWCPSW